MMLALLIIIPAIGGILAWGAARWGRGIARLLALSALATNLAIVLGLWLSSLNGPDAAPSAGPWLAEIDLRWIPSLGISFHLAADGLTLLFAGLTAVMGMVAVAVSAREIEERSGLFQLNLLGTLAGITGVFLAVDLFLFYFFWELMLVPMFLLFFWGADQQRAAALRFFIFTQAGSLLLLLAILGLYIAHGLSSGSYTFSYEDLLGTPLTAPVAFPLMLGFFAGFAVKLPVLPFHTWLPAAYAESPTPATIVLAALMSKTAGYGMLRLLVPLFPSAAQAFAPIAMALGVAGIIYGAFLAFSQTDLKRLVAYSSLSHMGFVVLGIFAWNPYSLQGAVMQMIAHGVSVGALFCLVGMLQQRITTRDARQIGGLWSSVPRFGSLLLLFALATLGLPGLGNFVGEFLVLLGAYRVNATLTSLATAGIVFSALYALWMIQQTLHGRSDEVRVIRDLSHYETAVVAVLAAIIIWLGLAPQLVLNTAEGPLNSLRQYSSSVTSGLPNVGPSLAPAAPERKSR